MSHESDNLTSINRRVVLQGALGAATLGLSSIGRAEDTILEQTVIKKARIKQSLVHWCYAPFWNMEAMIEVAKSLGCLSIELGDPKDFPLLKQRGLQCAIASIDMSPDKPFDKGFNNPKYHPRVIEATRKAIDACEIIGCKNVISFTGMSEGLADEEGATNCVDGYKQIVGYAEKKGVTICLEMLNTRASDHPMKGHPGYQGNHTDYCIDIIKRVGSPNLKLLFDVYHVQIMDGDVIRRVRQHKDYIGHVHTAGNPGRGELDDKQEIQYRPIMEALIEVGYSGFVGQEFIPTRDPLDGLKQAVAVCDV